MHETAIRRVASWTLPLLLACGGAPAIQEESSTSPAPSAQRLSVRVLRTLPHDPQAFTQGLLWHQGKLYESTGLYAASSLRRIDGQSGEIEHLVALPEDLFGEGLARLGDELVQLTWWEGVARRYRLADLTLVGEWRYSGEGWGLCFDGRKLVMTDGGAQLHFRNSATFEAEERRTVTHDGRPVDRLNELECAEGWVYANRLGSDIIYRIDPATGRVTATIDASPLAPRDPQPDQVLNGIAYDPETQRFYLTGKLWPRLYEVIFVP